VKTYTAFDLDKKVLDLDNAVITFQLTPKQTIDLSVRMAFRVALGQVFTDEQQTITLENKIFRNDIAEKIWRADLQVQLKTEEQAELKKCVGKMFIGEALGFLIKTIESPA
jgi:hypothetical protein